MTHDVRELNISRLATEINTGLYFFSVAIHSI